LFKIQILFKFEFHSNMNFFSCFKFWTNSKFVQIPILYKFKFCLKSKFIQILISFKYKICSCFEFWTNSKFVRFFSKSKFVHVIEPGGCACHRSFVRCSSSISHSLLDVDSGGAGTEPLGWGEPSDCSVYFHPSIDRVHSRADRAFIFLVSLCETFKEIPACDLQRAWIAYFCMVILLWLTVCIFAWNGTGRKPFLSERKSLPYALDCTCLCRLWRPERNPDFCFWIRGAQEE
jgi:hypothetical protein